jgi:hypothetical protein
VRGKATTANPTAKLTSKWCNYELEVVLLIRERFMGEGRGQGELQLDFPSCLRCIPQSLFNLLRDRPAQPEKVQIQPGHWTVINPA